MSGAAPESIALPRQGSHRHAHAIDQRPREHPYRQRQTRASSFDQTLTNPAHVRCSAGDHSFRCRHLLLAPEGTLVARPARSD